MSNSLLNLTVYMVVQSVLEFCYRKLPVTINITDFIEAYGYVAESHSVVTEDGYIVTVHRIPRKQYDSSYNEVRQPFRPVILIQHGIAGRSDNWLLNGPTSFPFVLNDAGYDVWLSDSRGNYYSKRHIRLSPNDPKFWDFSFHEQAYYDLPAMTDYIINTTGQSKIFYVGHSRGSTMIYVLLSLRPEYNDKFHLILNFAPVVYLRNSRSPLLQTIFKASTLDIKNLSRNFRLLTLPGINDKSVGFRKGLCVNGSATQLLCLQFIFSFAGYDHELFNTTNFPVISTHFPDGGSAKELLHYIQIANTDIFRPYDYNPETNLKVYGQYEPPEYNIENITAPMWLIYGRNDFVVSREKVP
ncbi:hypothetical protein RUM43_006095 [Polyplax serrata]|uniref:Lipase n=1 Tax=Polyplax serrata TaxID=468196 RepID=A0AAN8RV57_POLSC